MRGTFSDGVRLGVRHRGRHGSRSRPLRAVRASRPPRRPASTVSRLERAVVDLEAAQADRRSARGAAASATAPPRSGPAPAARRRRGSPRSPRAGPAPRAARTPARPSRSAAGTRPRRSSRNPAAIRARAIVGRPSASSSSGSSRATWSSIGRPISRSVRHGPLEPDAPRRALRSERRLERLVVEVHPEAEDVQLAVLERDAAGQGVDLDAGDQLDRRRHRPAEDEVADPGERVVVGDRERP